MSKASINKMVFDTLVDYRNTRDSDNKLYLAIYWRYYADFYQNFQDFFMSGEIDINAVCRESRRVRKEFEQLNGPKRFDRLKRAEIAKETNGKNDMETIEKLNRREAV